MNGRFFTQVVEEELKKRGMSVKEFCNILGVTQSSYSQWKNGREPKQSRIDMAEQILGIDFSVYSAPQTFDEETAELLNSLRERPDLGVLLRSARDVPPSSVYSLVAQLELEKERNENS